MAVLTLNTYGQVDTENYESLKKYGDYLARIKDNLQSPYNDQDFQDYLLDRKDPIRVLALPPSTGKTLSVISNIAQSYPKMSALIQIFKIEDIELVAVQIRALILHYHPEVSLSKLSKDVVTYHSNSSEKDPKNLSSIKILLTTHAKSICDLPEYYLFYHGKYRDYQIMDEAPKSIFREFSIFNLINLTAALEMYIKLDCHRLVTGDKTSKKDVADVVTEILNNDAAYLQVAKSVITEVMQWSKSKIRNSLTSKQNLVQIKLKIRESVLTLMGDEDNRLPTRSAAADYSKKIVYFVLFALKNYLPLRSNYEYLSRDGNILYTISDSSYSNLVILDGTGDLTLKGFPVTKPVSRSAKIDDVKTIEWTFSRKKSLTTQMVEHYHEVLNHFTQEFPQEKILVVTYKTLGAEGEVPLIDDLKKDYQNSNLRFISYGSGLERGSNDFQECSRIVVLGRYQPPYHYINTYNRALGTRINPLTYTEAEIIQAIYRTQLRQGKSIQIYFSEDYPREFISSVLTELGCDPSQFNLPPVEHDWAEKAILVPTGIYNLTKYCQENHTDTVPLAKVRELIGYVTHKANLDQVLDKVHLLERNHLLGSIYQEGTEEFKRIKKIMGDSIFTYSPYKRGRNGHPASIILKPEFLAQANYIMDLGISLRTLEAIGMKMYLEDKYHQSYTDGNLLSIILTTCSRYELKQKILQQEQENIIKYKTQVVNTTLAA